MSLLNKHAIFEKNSILLCVGVLITVAIGLGAGPVMEYAMAASRQLIEAPAYLQLLDGRPY